jgi:hypothetical protein
MPFVWDSLISRIWCNKNKYFLGFFFFSYPLLCFTNKSANEPCTGILRIKVLRDVSSGASLVPPWSSQKPATERNHRTGASLHIFLRQLNFDKVNLKHMAGFPWWRDALLHQNCLDSKVKVRWRVWGPTGHMSASVSHPPWRVLWALHLEKEIRGLINLPWGW